MSRVQLRLYISPGRAEAFINVKRKDSGFHRLSAVIDTGAQMCLLPGDLLDQLEHRLSERNRIVVEQAGIAQQAFEATEAFVTLFLEDAFGNRTRPLQVRAWFADTQKALLGFDGVLDRAILHVDMLETLTGWIEIND